MENFTFLPYLLIILALLAGIGGIIMLIFGLVHSKQKLWLPGSIIFLIAIIIGIWGMVIIIRSFVPKVVESVAKIEKKTVHYSNIFSDSLSYIDKPVDTTFSESISGFIEDSDNSLIYIKVFPKRDLIASGISLEKVDKGKRSKKVQKAISILLNFDKNYRGNLQLTVYDYEKKKLGKSITEVNNKAGNIEKINFAFADEVNLSSIDYGTLTFSE
ncbi:MAG: hypothetical protein WC599_00350 [Bacteroidales bacterium]